MLFCLRHALRVFPWAFSVSYFPSSCSSVRSLMCTFLQDWKGEWSCGEAPSINVTYSPWYATCFHFIGYCHIMWPHIKLPLVKTNQSTEDRTSMNTHSHTNVITSFLSNQSAEKLTAVQWSMLHAKHIKVSRSLPCSSDQLTAANYSNIKWLSLGERN